MGGGMHGEVHTEFGEETWGEDTTWINLGVDERIILKWIFKKNNGGLEWIYLAEDKDEWRAVVNAVIRFRVVGIYNGGKIPASWGTVSFSKRILPHGVNYYQQTYLSSF